MPREIDLSKDTVAQHLFFYLIRESKTGTIRRHYIEAAGHGESLLFLRQLCIEKYRDYEMIAGGRLTVYG